MSIPTVITVIQQHRAALLSMEQAAMQAAALRWLGVERALQSSIEALALQMANGEEPVTQEQLMLSRRYRNLRAQVDDELRRYSRYMAGRVEAGQRTMATLATQHSAAAVNAVATEAGIVVPFNRISIAAVEDMIGLAGDGSPLRAIMDDATAGAGDALGQRLIDGIALGKNPVEVARQAIRAGLGSSFTRMQAIARTEQLRVYRTSTLASYDASRVVAGYTRLSARDDRVCAGCLLADGRAYQINEGFDSHPQCRCTLLPRLANVAPIRYQTGPEWFTLQPEATQLAILGRGRYEAWRDGRASLDDLVTRQWDATWGGSLVPTLVRNLPR